MKKSDGRERHAVLALVRSAHERNAVPCIRSLRFRLVPSGAVASRREAPLRSDRVLSLQVRAVPLWALLEGSLRAADTRLEEFGGKRLTAVP